MMTELTREQKDRLEAWYAKEDELLREAEEEFALKRAEAEAARGHHPRPHKPTIGLVRSV